MKQDLISVVIPVYNAEIHLLESIKSIQEQDYKNLEIICIDDGSSDNSLNILNELSEHDTRIVVLKNTRNLGISNSLNKAINVAKGAYVARMDADDIASHDRLTLQKKFLEDNSDVSIVGSWVELFEARTEVWYYRQYDEFIKAMLLFRNNGVAHYAILVRSEFYSVFKYDSEFDDVEDTELWMRSITQDPTIKLSNIPKVLMQYRVHSSQISSIKSVQQDEIYRKLIKNYLNFFIGDVSDEELKLHYNLIIRPQNLSIEEIIDTGKWTKKLSLSFNKKINDKYYCISERWYRFCKEQKSEKAMSIFTMYADSEGKLCYL